MLTWLFWVSDFVKPCEQFFIYHGAGKLITFWLDGNDDVWFVLHQYTLLLDFNSFGGGKWGGYRFSSNNQPVLKNDNMEYGRWYR
jgi:hypothetical protein